MSEMKFKFELEKSIHQFAVPESLFQFAKEVPERYENGEFEGNKTSQTLIRGKRRFAPILTKCAAVAAILSVTFTAGVNISPAFAAYMKAVPGFEIAVDWLTQLRSRDGVQVAVTNGYMPIEPVTTQFGGTTITISDIYLTDDELLYKVFIRTNEYDVTDNRGLTHFHITPKYLHGGGSTTGASIARMRDGSKEPVLQVSYKFQLETNAVRDFFANGPDTLEFSVDKRVVNNELKSSKTEEMTTIAVPIDPEKQLYNKVLQPKQALPIAGSDPNWKQITLEKLTIQPTTMNAIISGQKGWTLDFPREEGTAPYLKDEKGNVYRFDPSGPGLSLEDSQIQLPFSSSVYFDSEAKTLQLHIGTVLVTEDNSSGSFELSQNDTFPKTVRFKNKDLVIEGAEFQDGYLRLKVKKEKPDQERLEGVHFFIQGYYSQIAQNKELGEKVDALRVGLNIYGWGLAENYNSQTTLDAYIPAPKQERYTISLQRVYDPVEVNQDYPISIK